jgi:single-strand DNA-binding protein
MNELVNSCRFVGRLGKDPEAQYSPKGSMVLKFSLAVNQRKWADGEYEKDTLWVDLVAFGKRAETMNTMLQKGTLVLVDAEYQKNNYTTRDGDKRLAHNFLVRSFQLLSGGRRSDENGDGSSDNEDNYYGGNLPDEDMPF